MEIKTKKTILISIGILFVLLSGCVEDNTDSAPMYKSGILKDVDYGQSSGGKITRVALMFEDDSVITIIDGSKTCSLQECYFLAKNNIGKEIEITYRERGRNTKWNEILSFEVYE